MDRCPQLSYRTDKYYSVNAAYSNEVKISLTEDGPAPFRLDVYNDFFDFWNRISPGAVYRQSGGSRSGGHAVLLIGWDDGKQAWLCKNSWGESGGPNGDGTFWIAYSGHANGLNFGMSNFTIKDTASPTTTSSTTSTTVSPTTTSTTIKPSTTTTSTTTTTLPSVARFSDPNLEAAIRTAISKPSGDIFASELQSLTSLDASGKNIATIEGLQYCTNLTTLSLESNKIINIGVLAGLTKLTSLGLWNNKISNINPLTGLTNLTFLALGVNQISDISALAGLTKLTTLGLFENKNISDINALAGLTSLKELYLNGNQISDISPLVANSGIGSGSFVVFYYYYDCCGESGNPLSTISCTVYIPQLQSRGVTVYHDCP